MSRTVDGYGFVFEQDDGLRHWALWNVPDERSLMEETRNIRVSHRSGWVICEKEHGRYRTQYFSTSSRDVTCLACTSMLGASIR